MDAELEEFFIKQDAYIDGKDEGILIGKNEGIHLEKMNLARKLYKKGTDDKTILELTELKKEELDKIKEECKKEN